MLSSVCVHPLVDDGGCAAAPPAISATTTTAAFNLAESGYADRPDLDDDGREKRTGTLVTASAHIITAVIGSGVLSLAWAIAQLGWVIGPAVLVA
ncbi:amino acid transporter, partial [Ectobacillus sp. SYSU M60031]|nr:amino acid transporter [Ectobacillus ponti]